MGLVLLEDKRFRYLLVGGANTVFSYVLALLLYRLLQGRLHITAISALVAAISIGVSFLTQKTLVFRTKGNWLAEFCKTCLVYSLSAAFYVLGMWASVDALHIAFWSAQLFMMAAMTGVTYICHSRFTFKTSKKESWNEEQTGR